MDLFAALADPTRREILELLSHEDGVPATDIYNKFTVSHPAISQHLKVLRGANLVLVEKRAQKRIYRLNSRTMNELEEWVKHLTEEWNAKFDVLDKVLQEEKKKPRNVS